MDPLTLYSTLLSTILAMDPLTLYPTLLSTILAIVEIRKYFREGEVQLKIHTEVLSKEKIQELYKREKRWQNPIRVTITNTSKQHCQIGRVFLHTWNGEKIEKLDQNLPVNIEGGEAYTFEFSPQYRKPEYDEMIATKKVIFQTSDGTLWPTKWYPFQSGHTLARFVQAKKSIRHAVKLEAYLEKIR